MKLLACTHEHQCLFCLLFVKSKNRWRLWLLLTIHWSTAPKQRNKIELELSRPPRPVQGMIFLLTWLPSRRLKLHVSSCFEVQSKLCE